MQALASLTDDADTAQSLFIECRFEAIRWAAHAIQSEFTDATWSIFQATAIEGRPATEVAQAFGRTIGAVYAARCRVAARVLLVPSSPGEQARSGRITSVNFAPDEDGLASFIQSNIACPLSEFGSLMVSEAGEPIGLVLSSRSNFLPDVRRQEMEPTSIAVPLKAIQTVLQAALDKPRDVPLVRLPSSRAIDINKPVSITLVPTPPLLVLQELANLLALVAREEGTDSGSVDRSTLLKLDLQPATPLAKSLVELFAKRGATVLIYEEGKRLQVEAPPKTMEDLNKVFQFLQDPIQR